MLCTIVHSIHYTMNKFSNVFFCIVTMSPMSKVVFFPFYTYTHLSLLTSKLKKKKLINWIEISKHRNVICQHKE